MKPKGERVMKREIQSIAMLASFGCTLALAKWPSGTEPLATAALQPKSGTKVTGTVDIGRSSKGLLVRVYVKDIAPGPHGIHIHEKGDCSSPDGESAGGHFNPTGDKHGGTTSRSRHVGDFGNIVVDKSGGGEFEIKVPAPAKPFAWEQLVGKAIVIHGGKDDLSTQPSGNSGDRIACGVLGEAKPAAE
jgi:superoxide dismutase, Cu-Zn family